MTRSLSSPRNRHAALTSARLRSCGSRCAMRRCAGCGVLLISSDLDELFDISDRLVVMLSGRVAAEFRPPFRLSDVGAAMTGAR